MKPAVRSTIGCRPALEQPTRELTLDLEQAIVYGAYWMRKPGPNAQIVVAYTGAVAPEAIQAVGTMGEYHRDIGLRNHLRRSAECWLDRGASGA
jgi:pyruvate dehydrogenase complex dehydrogenase (E1) component